MQSVQRWTTKRAECVLNVSKPASALRTLVLVNTEEKLHLRLEQKNTDTHIMNNSFLLHLLMPIGYCSVLAGATLCCWQQRVESAAVPFYSCTVVFKLLCCMHTPLHTLHTYMCKDIHTERSANPFLMTNMIMRSRLKANLSSLLTPQSGGFRCLYPCPTVRLWIDVQSDGVFAP